MMDLYDCYETLGLKPGASLEKVQSAYRKLAKEWHPDRLGHDALLRRIGEARMKEVNEARQTLLAFLSFHRYPFQYIYGKSATAPRKESEREPVTEDKNSSDFANPSFSKSQDKSTSDFVDPSLDKSDMVGIAMAFVVCLMICRSIALQIEIDSAIILFYVVVLLISGFKR